MVLQPGPEGEDTAPYQFLPSSPRGLGESLWVFTDLATNQHSFRTYLRFELPPDLLGPDETVGSALLALFFDREIGFGMTAGEGPATIECRPVLTDWVELSASWIDQPAFGDPVDVETGIDEFGDVTCRVTDLVADWAFGITPNRGFAITNPTDRLIGFPSFEATVDGGPDPFRPRLLINVVPVPEPAAGAGAALAALAWLARIRGRRPGGRPARR